MKVVGYARVSTDEQADEGTSLSAQAAKIRGYADLYDLELVDVVEDAGFSGKDMCRPGLQKALAMLEAREIDGILVSKLDRLTRNIGDMHTLIVRYFQKPQFILRSVGDEINTGNASGRLVLNLLMSVYQWERETIVERTVDALRHKKQNGERTGAVPYGYDLAPDGVKLVENNLEQFVIGRIRSWKEQGRGPTWIAEELNREGVRTKQAGVTKNTKGGPVVVAGLWDKKTVSRLLEKSA